MFKLQYKEVPFCTRHTEEGDVSDRRLQAFVPGVGGDQILFPHQEMFRVQISPGQWMCWDEYEVPGMGTVYNYGIWHDDSKRRPGHGGYWNSRPSVLGWYLEEHGPVRMLGINNSLAVRLSQCDLSGLPDTHQVYRFMADEGPCPDYGEIWLLVKGWHEHDDRFVPLEVKND